MKRLFLFLATLLISISPFTILADPPTPPNPPTDIDLIQKEPSPKRPNSSNVTTIKCYYWDNTIEIILPAANFSASILLYNDNEGIIETITRDNNTIIHNLSGKINIECYTDDGNVFFGQFSI